MRKMDRRGFLAGSAAGALLFNIGCAGFGRGRRSQLAAGAPIRIAIIGCGSWGRTLLNRAGAVGGCEVAALCEPDAKALAELKSTCAKKRGRAAIDAAKTYRAGWEVA